ncbi:MAG: caspase family protein [Ferruginibacter sp.]
MKVHLVFFLIVFFCKTVSAQTVPAQANAATGTGNVYALLVGVSKYSDPDIPQLQFANKDAEVFADFLKSKAGGSVPAANIRLLTDSNASIAAVHMAIKWLVRTCKKGDMVFFYFSGHGDLESMSMFSNAYFICYNTPLESYVGMSLSVSFLNDIANTLSAQTEARVVLITDACHSGKMTANSGNSNLLVGKQLMNANEKEIRIASSQFDQLSNEKTDWGGGRGVFSYYLEKGLKGLADNSKDGIVTMGEIKTYLESAMGNDPILKQEHKIQTPVFKGMDGFALAKVDAEELAKTRQQSVADSAKIMMVSSSPMAMANDATDAMPDDYFISLLKKGSLEALTDSLKLNKLGAGEIAVALINRLKDSLKNEAGIAKLNELLTSLRTDKESLNRLNEMLLIEFDNKVQEVINQYLKGDEAELERRRYYNIKNNGYDVYPRMLQVALQLTDPSSFYYNILQVKLHYFTGVTLRLKIPATENPAPLIKQALAEQLKALALEKTAAYIYNELGILYLFKKEYAKAEEYFTDASKRNDKWAIPWANLSGMYALTEKYEKGFEANHKADSLQAGIQNNVINLGLLNERSGNLLFAEEDYRKAIDINSRHFLPFERLGYVYLNTTNYAASDSFFYEADLRKKGYHFDGNLWLSVASSVLAPVLPPLVCAIDTAHLDDRDFMAFFYWGIKEYDQKHYANALRILQKVIAVDAENPLVFHYIGKIYFDQQRWEEAEIYFQYAIDYSLDDSAFNYYVDSEIHSAVYPYEHTCFEKFYKMYYYQQDEDLYFIAHVYEAWKHFDEAEKFYKKIIEAYPDELGGYIKLWQLMEKMGRYTQAENVIEYYADIDEEVAYKELNTFYRRTIEKYPNNGEWNYKLGLLLYNNAKHAAMYRYFDTLIWFPKLNKEVFIDHDIYTTLGTNSDLTFDRTGSGIPDLIYTTSSTKVIVPPSYMIPGTKEYLSLAEPVYMPRKDGIRYLSRAAELLSEKEVLAEIHYKIGDIYVWAGSKKQAFPYYKAAVQFDPGNANTRLSMVDAGIAIYKNREVLEQLDYLYDSSLINFPNRLLYAEFTMYKGQFERSKKVLEEANGMQPYEWPEIHDLQGRLNMLSNKPALAVKDYKAYSSIVPDDPNVEYTLARLYAMQGKQAEAFKWMGKAIKNGFNYSFVLATDPLMAGLRKTDKWKVMMKAISKKEWHRTTSIN